MKIICVFLGVHLLISTNSFEWKSEDCNGYSFILNKNGNEYSGLFYGTCVTEKMDTIYYRANCEDLIINDSVVSFSIKDFWFNKNTFDNWDDKFEFKDPDLNVFLPNRFLGKKINNGKQIEGRITKLGGFSNSENCIFFK
ncbi:hypothetical protein KFE98_19610 [bacterium SCSIO 12741]|nr:hypothetical protein KFE98_19610 [bacterium SCSIO 12741]